VFLDYVDPICFLPLVTLLHAFLKLNTYLAFRIGIYGWVELLSPIVMSVVQVFHLYDVEYGLCLCESVVVSQASRCELTVVRIDALV
jgi:hypothetical protein